MHCEGEKTYDEMGDCPVCGMDLLEQPNLTQVVSYTCPMHPEIIQDHPGDCPICGMSLVPLDPSDSAEQKTYKELVKKMKIATSFAIPIFIISMSELIPGSRLTILWANKAGIGFSLFSLYPLFSMRVGYFSNVPINL